jgi:DNA-binding PadR family transcriptional regulator
MELSATAKVILGMLAMRPRSGYEIKSFADESTKYFWAASYGQIYPELRRLADAGLIEGEHSPTGGRQRTVYRLTKAGRQTLREWHELPPEVFEHRDEGLLKLFLADAVAPKRAAEIARQYAELAAKVADELREVEANVGEKDPAPHTVLRFGIEHNDWVAEWFEGRALELEKGIPLPNAEDREKGKERV